MVEDHQPSEKGVDAWEVIDAVYESVLGDTFSVTLAPLPMMRKSYHELAARLNGSPPISSSDESIRESIPFLSLAHAVIEDRSSTLLLETFVDDEFATVDLVQNEILPKNTRLEAAIYLMPGEKSEEEVDNDEWYFIMSSDPFRVDTDGTIQKDPHPDQLDAVEEDAFSRELIEGAYLLTVTGRTGGKDWEAGLLIWKGAYIQGINRSRGRSRPEYVSCELTEGLARELADILSGEASENGFSTDAEKVEFVIDYVQRLPYVTDDVSKGFDDYTKFIIETLSEASGDCEDTAIMLAATLEAEPFGYDMVLIQPPGHMAAGIWGGESMTGTYYEKDGRKYYYIETTGEGWGIGDIPDIYEGESAYVHLV